MERELGGGQIIKGLTGHGKEFYFIPITMASH